MLAVHDALTTYSRKAQHKLGTLVNQGRHAAHTASLDQLAETACRPAPDGPLGGRETKTLAKARCRSLEGAGPTAYFWAQPTDSLRLLPATELVAIGRRFMGSGEHVSVRCPCCDANHVDTRHARICPRAGVQANQH